MKKTILNLIALTMVVSAFANGEHHDWEDHHVLQINREPARAYFIPYGEKQGDRMLSLNGDWQFRWTKTPEGRIKDFENHGFQGSRHHGRLQVLPPPGARNHRTGQDTLQGLCLPD